MPSVIFDPAAWKARYPEFAAVTSADATLYFNEATLYLDNSDASPVQDIPTRTTLLNMLTAHIAQLYSALTSQGSGQLVGRVSSASEGSVSVQTDFGSVTDQEKWYAQTKYGSSYWRATARWRQFMWIAACPPVVPGTPY